MKIFENMWNDLHSIVLVCTSIVQIFQVENFKKQLPTSNFKYKYRSLCVENDTARIRNNDCAQCVVTK